MSDTIIRVENLGKKYIIGHQQEGERYTALRDVIANGVKGMLNRFSHPKPNTQNPKSEEFWALKDVSFEIKQGDRVGIIGRNGAGKSTLLKILSRITEPTTGSIRIKGRVASLLEVGTGFHPELTGRENIFLNGAILGMSRVEIRRKFDEIVAFAEVEKFLDTPVKRYSSGMYVRLAFAVAAHLEPEILIVDEVLAVGDVQFQKKCLGKMEEVGKKGRTVIFVSHNMAAVRAFCNRAILMSSGQIASNSKVQDVIEKYLSEGELGEASIAWTPGQAPRSAKIRLIKAYVTHTSGIVSSIFEYDDEILVNLEYELCEQMTGLRIGLLVQNNEGVIMFGTNEPFINPKGKSEPGVYVSRCKFPSHIFNSGLYSIKFGVDVEPYREILVSTEFCVSFTVEDTRGHGVKKEKLPGVTRPNSVWYSRETASVSRH